MARFIATAGGVSRLGHAPRGIDTTCNGWNAGVTVEASADGDRDGFDVYMTGGSNGNTGRVLLGCVTFAPGEDAAPVWAPASREPRYPRNPCLTCGAPMLGVHFHEGAGQ